MARDISETGVQRSLPWPRRRPIRIFAVALLLAGFFLVFAAEYLLHNAGPLLRKRILATLSTRFNAPVELDAFNISLFRGIEVNGNGLRIGYSAGTAPVSVSGSPDHPMIAVQHFAFRTGLRSLLGDTLARRPFHIGDVRVEGLELHIPPSRNRSEPQRAKHPREPETYGIIVNELQCRDVKLFLESAKSDLGPGGENRRLPPLEFDMGTLDLENVGRHQAMHYDARLLNAKPVGAIHAYGHFGPWANETTDDPLAGNPDHQPGQTPIDGNYTFDHADLSTIKGIAGTLSSSGHFAGILDRMAIDGHTDTPDFSLNLANHPTPLHTDFHALIDSTNGDIYLQPVHALLGGSAFTTSGSIVRVKGRGHDILLNVEIPHGHIQDFLRLTIKTSPPLLNGTLSLKATLHIPPGDSPVPEKLSVAGSFTITGVRFNNPRWQDRMDGLSARATGHPELAKAAAGDGEAETHSQLAANFTINHGIMGITDMHFGLPGALVLMNGVYSMDGKLFEFKGHVRTQATASQMVGGWKGLLLSPLDHYLQRNGAGIELPVEISGTQGDIHVGLATSGADEKPTQLLTEIRQKLIAKQQFVQGRDLFDEANAEDLAAAHAPTLEEAQRHHNNAVRLRTEAQAKAAAAASIR